MNQMIDPQSAQTTTAGQGMDEQAKRRMLMQAMMAQNGNQQPARSTGAAVTNALAQGLQGYMMGKQMQGGGGGNPWLAGRGSGGGMQMSGNPMAYTG